MSQRALVVSGLIIFLLLSLIAGMLVGCNIIRLSPTPTPTPSPTVLIQPAIRLDPPSGAPGTTITISGTGWPPNGQVSIYAGLSQAEAIQAASWKEAVPDAAGRFTVEIMAPLFEKWDRGVDWFIVARAKTANYDAYGVFSIPNPTPATPMPTTPAPTATRQAVRLEGSVQALDPGTRTVGLKTAAGLPYLITLAPDAVLVDLDGQPVSLADVTLGTQAVVEGFMEAGGAVTATHMIVSLRLATATPSLTPTAPPADGWEARYFDNDSLLGNPVVKQTDPRVDMNWGRGSPDPLIPPDHFSARWTRTVGLKTGGYHFHVQADDGVRVWLNDSLIIDEWHDAVSVNYEVDKYLTAGQYTIKVDYYEAEGEAFISFGYEAIVSYPDWKGEYYNNMTLSGDPSLVRNDPNIDYDWGDGAPAEGINVDRFSIRWKRVDSFEAGTYRFFAYADDGVRVWVAGGLIIDEWHNSDGSLYQGDVALLDQSYEVLVEYYDNGGRAQVHFWWERLADETPTPTITPSRTPTASATPTWVLPTLTATSTATARPATATVPLPTATATHVPPTPTATKPQPTATATAVPPTPTATPIPPTPTVTLPPSPTATAVPPTPTATAGITEMPPPPTSTPTVAQLDLPDLLIRTVKIELQTVDVCFEPGMPLGLRVEIANAGPANAGPFIVEANGERATVDAGLAAGASTSLWFAGYRYPDVNLVIVDIASQVTESNEENNIFNQPVPIPTPPPACSPTATPASSG